MDKRENTAMVGNILRHYYYLMAYFFGEDLSLSDGGRLKTIHYFHVLSHVICSVLTSDVSVKENIQTHILQVFIESRLASSPRRVIFRSRIQVHCACIYQHKGGIKSYEINE